MKIPEIIEFLVARRKMLGVKQEELAKLAGISVHALSNFETGKGNPTIELLFKVANALGAKITVGVERM